MPSAHDGNTNVLIEVKTAQDRNRGVIRTSQIGRYRQSAEATNIYYAQIFYRMRSGLMPSKVKIDDFEADFFPLCIYIFPISFIVYLVNTVQPTGQKESTQFYGLTHHRAKSLFEMLHTRGLFPEKVTEKYRAQVFTTTHLPQNPDARLHIIDHIDVPHILGHVA